MLNCSFISNFKFCCRFMHAVKKKKLYCKCVSIDRSSHSLSHTPVMVNEVLDGLNLGEGNTVVDMTFGAGGHTRALLNSVKKLKVICLDRDPLAYNLAKTLAADYPGQIIPVHGTFSQSPKKLMNIGIKKNSLDGILFDFGCSSMQFDCPERGFSISQNGPLDMRMGGTEFDHNVTAKDVLSYASEEDLTKIFKIYGQEKNAKKIARAIVEARYTFINITTTQELASFIEYCCSKHYYLDKLQRPSHVATKIFQALRIFVNNELNEIDYGMLIAHRFLKVGGRVVTLSFHSLEDTIVKRHLTGNMLNDSINPLSLKYSSYETLQDQNIFETLRNSKWKPLNKHVLTPTVEEVHRNPRSRSAKLRAAIKIS